MTISLPYPDCRDVEIIGVTRLGKAQVRVRNILPDGRVYGSFKAVPAFTLRATGGRAEIAAAMALARAKTQTPSAALPDATDGEGAAAARSHQPYGGDAA